MTPPVAAPRGRSIVWPLALTVALAVVIAVLTMTPPPPDDGLPPGPDKLYHFVAFAALALPLASARPRWILPLFLGMSAYGGAIEILQPLTGRSRELGDLLADMTGVAAGILLGLLMGRVLLRSFRIRKRTDSTPTE